ncbi:hypothetical protein LTR95_004145 [Oleoguttula sp. CCFEE 5521]
MYRPAFRALALPRAVPRVTRRTLTTAPPHKTSRSFKNTALRWTLAGGLVYYYNVSNVWAEEPAYAVHAPPEFGNESEEVSTSIESIAAQRRAQARATQSQSPQPLQSSTPAAPVDATSQPAPSPGSPEALEEEASQQGAFNEETGEINWDCPCLGGMADGPCGEQFRAAFSCFVFSKEEPKGVDCIENFKGMQDCFRLHPEVYGSELEEEEVDGELERQAGGAEGAVGGEAEQPVRKTADEKAQTPAVQEMTRSEPVSESEELVPKAWHDGTAGPNKPSARKQAIKLHHGGTRDSDYPNRNPRVSWQKRLLPDPEADYKTDSTRTLYDRLEVTALEGRCVDTREIAEILVRERKERPNLDLYYALILSNTSADHGAAWRVAEYLDELAIAGLEADSKICHAVLKVLAVHVDHLMRTGILEYMKGRWFEITAKGKQDIAAGMLREGSFEQALEVLDEMQGSGMEVEPWLLDVFIYTLCEAGEVGEAHTILKARHDSGEKDVSKNVWAYMLDKASAECEYDAAVFAWKNTVNLGFLNPPSGICLNILTTASRAGDPALATDVFTHLSKRGETFTYLHYQLLLDAYLGADPPDLKRALTILTLMPQENLPPTAWQTRSLFAHLKNDPALTDNALQMLRELHAANKPIPIAALNLLIECHVSRKDLQAALTVYKLIHTFAPIAEGPKPTFADIETFNLLLRACRTAKPPDEGQASFLVSELLVLRVKPTALTYDRLILVFLASGAHHLPIKNAEGLRLLDYAYRHWNDMVQLGWMPRFGTLEKLALDLGKVGDGRCWDVLQTCEERGKDIEGWAAKEAWVKRGVEKVWAEQQARTSAEYEGAGVLAAA